MDFVEQCCYVDQAPRKKGAACCWPFLLAIWRSLLLLLYVLAVLAEISLLLLSPYIFIDASCTLLSTCTKYVIANFQTSNADDDTRRVNLQKRFIWTSNETKKGAGLLICYTAVAGVCQLSMDWCMRKQLPGYTYMYICTSRDAAGVRAPEGGHSVPGLITPRFRMALSNQNRTRLWMLLLWLIASFSNNMSSQHECWSEQMRHRSSGILSLGRALMCWLMLTRRSFLPFHMRSVWTFPPNALLAPKTASTIRFDAGCVTPAPVSSPQPKHYFRGHAKPDKGFSRRIPFNDQHRWFTGRTRHEAPFCARKPPHETPLTNRPSRFRSRSRSRDKNTNTRATHYTPGQRHKKTRRKGGYTAVTRSRQTRLPTRENRPDPRAHSETKMRPMYPPVLSWISSPCHTASAAPAAGRPADHDEED